MKPNNKFQNKSTRFWAVVKAVSEHKGYSLRVSKGEERGSAGMRRYALKNILETHNALKIEKAVLF